MKRKYKLIEGIKKDEYLININGRLILAIHTLSEGSSCDECILYNNKAGIDTDICIELFDRIEGRGNRSELKLCSPYYTCMNLVRSTTYLSLFIMSYIRCDCKYINYIVANNHTLAINC